MAKLTTMDGTKVMTGAVRKKKEQGVDHFSNTRQKRFVDPETGEVLKLGPNEMFIQKWRDYTKAPRTPAEQVQNLKWRDACKLAQQIKKDRTHPMYESLHTAWRAQIHSPNPIVHFDNFIAHALASKN